MFNKNFVTTTLRSIFSLAVVIGLLGIQLPKPVSAATLIVTNTNDSGPGSLRQAIANAITGDTITFNSSLSGQTITLASSLIIDKNLTIDGSALASKINISGNNTVRVLKVNSGLTVTLNALVIKNGFHSTEEGGGILNLGTLNIMNTAISGNVARHGGGIFNSGVLNVTASEISGNSVSGPSAASGGGIINFGTLTISNSTLSNNHANQSGLGGGVANKKILNVIESVFSGNTALQGGGIDNNTANGNTTISKSTFSGNSAEIGGGIANSATLNIIKSTFSANSGTVVGGGGIYNGALGGTLTLADSTFSNNSAGGHGGGVRNAGTMTSTNNTFSGNSANSDGGGIYNENILTIINNTFSANLASSYGGGIFSYGTLNITNSTFSGNTGSGIYNAGTLNYVNTILANSSFDCYNSGTIGININNLVETNSVSPYDCGTPTFISDPNLGLLTDNGGSTQTMALGAGSPAINAGTNTDCPVTDQRGVTRPQGGQCDIGAYEKQNIHYVKSNASGVHNGTSWASAYSDLQSALSAASSGDEIWVAAGTYKPTATTDRTISFTLKNGVALYGGFAGTETLRTQRNPSTNVTVLSGEIGAAGTADNSYHVVVGGGTNNTAVLDGFTITKGNADDLFDPHAWGGGMHILAGSPSLVNLIFTSNTAKSGGGIALDNSNSILLNVTFNDNSAGGGGGMLVVAGSPILSSVTFSGNTAFNGGGVSISNSNPTLENVTFSGNVANSKGGGIYTYGSPVLRNVTFSGNIASNVGGGGIYNESSTPTIINSILWNNVGGEIENYDANTPVVSYSFVQGGYSGTGNIDLDPLLGTLANNGGFTQTMALGAGSPAINAGDDATCAATDQRGVTRPQGSHCDIGAYEYNSADVNVTIGGNSVGTYSLDPGERTSPRYGINGGPVHVVSTNGKPIFTSQRAIYGNSFNSIVGYPGNQLTNEYWFTSLDDLGMITYLVIGNPSTTLTAHVDVYIAGNKMNITPYAIAPGQRVFPRYGINGGPVHVVSDIPVFTSERTKYGNSFNEVLGYPANQLTTEYWFTSLDDLGMITYLVIGNPSTVDTALVDVYIAGNKMNTTPYSIAPGQRVFPRYGINGGPVQVVSTNGVPIFTSERTKYGNSFNEVLGYPGNKLALEYWFTSLDDASMITYLVIGNPSTTLTAHVDVYINGIKQNTTPYAIAPGQRVFPRYGVNSGAVRVVSDIPIFTSERSKYQSSFNEILGVPTNQLTTDYWFTSLDDLGMATELVIAAP